MIRIPELYNYNLRTRITVVERALWNIEKGCIRRYLREKKIKNRTKLGNLYKWDCYYHQERYEDRLKFLENIIDKISLEDWLTFIIKENDEFRIVLIKLKQIGLENFTVEVHNDTTES